MERMNLYELWKRPSLTGSDNIRRLWITGSYGEPKEARIMTDGKEQVVYPLQGFFINDDRETMTSITIKNGNIEFQTWSFQEVEAMEIRAPNLSGIPDYNYDEDAPPHADNSIDFQNTR